MHDPWQWRPDQPAYARQPASLIRLNGPDSRRFLHGQTSAAIETAASGQWVATCCITPTGRMRALAEVLIDAAGAWLAVTGGDGDAVHDALERVLFPADQVQLSPPQPGWLLTPVAGRGETLPDAAGQTWQTLPGEGGWQLGSGPLGQAVLLVGEAAHRPQAWAERRRLSDREQEHWRLMRGRPAVPGELQDQFNPFELGLTARVSLSKGCYVGQETLARLATYDGVKQQLRRWQWAQATDQQPPCCGQVLHPTPERGSGHNGSSNPDRVGQISSMLELETGDRIGLALVRRSALGAAQLLAGDGETAAWIDLSLPEDVQAPPGPGGTQGP